MKNAPFQKVCSGKGRKYKSAQSLQGIFPERDKRRHKIRDLSTYWNFEKPCKMDLYTDLSTLSTKKAFKKLVYIDFSGNRRFVDYDVFRKSKKKIRKWVDK